MDAHTLKIQSKYPLSYTYGSKYKTSMNNEILGLTIDLERKTSERLPTDSRKHAYSWWFEENWMTSNYSMGLLPTLFVHLNSMSDIFDI